MDHRAWPPAEPGDEAPDRADAEGTEHWVFDLATGDGRLGAVVELVVCRRPGTVAYTAAVVGAGRRPVLVVDHEVPLPRRTGSLELRSPGLWADHNVEEPLQRWSVGLEAFGVALDHPADGRRGLRGDRTAVGFDLEWVAAGASFRPPPGTVGYEVPCVVHGEVLLDDEIVDLDAGPPVIGHRARRRRRAEGPEPWCLTVRSADGTRWFAEAPALSGERGAGYVVGPRAVEGLGSGPGAGAELGTSVAWCPTVRVSLDLAPGVDDLPPFGTARLGDVAVGLEPVAWAVAPDPMAQSGGPGWRRGLVRAEVPGGGPGVGWLALGP
jgi:hypothetical protein